MGLTSLLTNGETGSLMTKPLVPRYDFWVFFESALSIILSPPPPGLELFVCVFLICFCLCFEFVSQSSCFPYSGKMVQSYDTFFSFSIKEGQKVVFCWCVSLVCFVGVFCWCVLFLCFVGVFCFCVFFGLLVMGLIYSSFN